MDMNLDNGRLVKEILKNRGKTLEDHAFALREKEVSPVIDVPNGFVIIKCDRRLPADTSVAFEKVRADLLHDVTERKSQQKFPALFSELQAAAKPERLLERKP